MEKLYVKITDNKSGAAMVTEGIVNENQSAGTLFTVANTHSLRHKQQLQHTYLLPTFVTVFYPYG